MAVLHFAATLTVPAGTSASSPAVEEITTAPGVAKLLRLYVPPGPRGEVSLYLRHMERRIAPVPPASWDKLDDDVIDYALNLEVKPAEVRFALVGWSPTASFSHDITFEIHVETAQAPAPAVSSISLLERIGGVLGF